MKLFSRIILSLVFLLSIQTAYSQNGTPNFDTGLLWKISGKGLSQPSYILGSHHFAHLSFLDSIAGLEKAINETQQTVGELILSKEAMIDMQSQVLKYAMMPEGISYNSLLSDDNYRRLDSLLIRKLNIGLFQLEKIKPAMISQLYVIRLYKILDPSFNETNHIAIDDYLQREAIKQNKPVLALETIGEQIDALYGDSLEQQLNDLFCTLENNEYSLKSLDLLNEYYKQGLLKQMYDLYIDPTNDPCQSTVQQKDKLNKNRNEKMLKKIPKIIEGKSSLIVVGALHLAGEEGLLAGLSKIGYSVERAKQ